MYIVVLKNNDGDYILATRSVFYERDIAQRYADGCCYGAQQPLVVQIDTLELEDFRTRHPVLYEAYSIAVRLSLPRQRTD